MARPHQEVSPWAEGNQTRCWRLEVIDDLSIVFQKSLYALLMFLEVFRLHAASQAAIPPPWLATRWHWRTDRAVFEGFNIVYRYFRHRRIA